MTTITFVPFDPDLSNLVAATLNLNEEYVIVDDITHKGGEINYLVIQYICWQG